MKTCKICNTAKSMPEFYRSAKSSDGRNSYCKSCSAAISRERYAATKPEHSARSKAWREANPEHDKARRAKWRVANLQKARAASTNWQRANPGKAAASAMKRYAAKTKATPAWADHKAIEAYYDTAAGLSMLLGEWYEVDHIVPLRGKTVCGLHAHTNLRVITAAENQRKGNRHAA